MTLNPGVSQPPSRRIVLLTKVKTKTMRLGATTMAFFRKGEELEATEFENLPHDDPALVPPKLGFRNFDRVPRKRTPLLFAFLVVLVASCSILGWRRVYAQTARGASVLQVKASEEWLRLKAAVAARRAAP
jgi:hypothetical protein